MDAFSQVLWGGGGDEEQLQGRTRSRSDTVTFLTTQHNTFDSLAEGQTDSESTHSLGRVHSEADRDVRSDSDVLGPERVPPA